MAEFTDKESKQLNDLGVSLANIQGEIEKLKAAGTGGAELKTLSGELAAIKEQIKALAPKAPESAAPAVDFLDFLGLGWLKPAAAPEKK